MPLISISGSQGSGKSTLIRKIKEKMPEISIVERKTSRSILSEWNIPLSVINETPELSVKFQEEILQRKIDDDTALLQGDDVVITERTPVDLFVYALVNMGKHNQWSDWLNQYYYKCKEACSIYDRVIFLPSGQFDVKEDGIRSHNQHYSTMIDSIMQTFYSKMFYENNIIVPVKAVDIEERFQQIQRYLMLK